MGCYVSPSPWGIGSPSTTWYLGLGPTPVIIPNSNSIGSAVFVCDPNAMLYNALSIGKKTLKIALSPWDFVTPPKEDRATAMGNMHKKMAKIARVVWVEVLWFGLSVREHIYARGQTDTDTQTRSLYYLATAPATCSKKIKMTRIVGQHAVKAFQVSARALSWYTWVLLKSV